MKIKLNGKLCSVDGFIHGLSESLLLIHSFVSLMGKSQTFKKRSFLVTTTLLPVITQNDITGETLFQYLKLVTVINHL